METSDARPPVKRSRGGVIFAREPEGSVVHGIDRQIAVIPPTIRRSGLAAGPGEQSRFALREGAHRIARQARGVTELRPDCGTRRAESQRQIPLPVHCRASHPTPGRVWLIGALLEQRNWPGGHVAQFEPADPGDSARTNGKVSHHRFMPIGKLAISEAEHKAVANGIETIASSAA